jgi:hypothetical protein
MENLPPDVQPTALLRLYARIDNIIVATWRDPKAFGAYMDSLLHDKRGNRRGYSSEVDAELVALKRPHDVGRQVSINGCYGARCAKTAVGRTETVKVKYVPTRANQIKSR